MRPFPHGRINNTQIITKDNSMTNGLVVSEWFLHSKVNAIVVNGNAGADGSSCRAVAMQSAEAP